jgi:hypothetical protein
MSSLNPARMIRVLGLLAILLSPVFAQDAFAFHNPASYDGPVASSETSGPTVPGPQDVSDASPDQSAIASLS